MSFGPYYESILAVCLDPLGDWGRGARGRVRLEDASLHDNPKMRPLPQLLYGPQQVFVVHDVCIYVFIYIYTYIFCVYQNAIVATIGCGAIYKQGDGPGPQAALLL